MWPGNGVLGAPKTILRGCPKRFRLRRQPFRVPPRPPCGIICCSLLKPLETYEQKLLCKSSTIPAKQPSSDV
eukprot:7299377-Pyramimonas_sp.AAC.1